MCSKQQEPLTLTHTAAAVFTKKKLLTFLWGSYHFQKILVLVFYRPENIFNLGPLVGQRGYISETNVSGRAWEGLCKQASSR